MRGHAFDSQPLGEMMRHAFRESASIYKHEGRPMLPYEFRDSIVNFVPHLVRSHRTQFAGRHFDGEIHLALMPDLHNDGIGPSASCKKMRDQLDGLLRGGQTDAKRGPIGKRFQSLQRQRQMGAAFVIGNGVNLVDNYGLDAAQHFAAFSRSQQDVERFRSGD